MADQLETKDGVLKKAVSRLEKAKKESALQNQKGEIARLLSLIKVPSTLKITSSLSCGTSEKSSVEETHMIFVKGGTFQMGSHSNDPNSDDDEKPQHEVTLSDFYMCKYPVTQALWRAVMKIDPKELRYKGYDNCPVEGVSWNEVQVFLKRLNSRTGKSYRLPTEAEWEYAARGGNLRTADFKFSGGNDLKSVGWFSENSKGNPHPVGELRANELGLYDMSGNVFEWCIDWYGGYFADSQTNPKGAKTGKSRVVRGGSWIGSAQACRVVNRSILDPDDRSCYIGFRMAHSLL